MVTVNVVVSAGTVAAEPVERRMPSGDEVTELRLSVPEAGKRLLPLPDRGVAYLGRQTCAEGHRQRRRRAGLRDARPPLLPQRRRRAQPDGGGRDGDQEAGAGRATRPRRARPRASQRHEDDAGARLRPEVRRLLREALAAFDDLADPIGRGGRQAGRRRRPRPLVTASTASAASGVNRSDPGGAIASSSPSWSARTAGGSPARVPHA